MNTNTGFDQTYWNKRNKDVEIEATCASFVDEYWFKHITNGTYDRVSGEDSASTKRQLRGEDVVLLVNDKPVFIIDEKAKLQGGLVNHVLGYPSFEILCRNKNNTGHFKSWFVAKGNTTTHYAMISVASDKEIGQGEEWKITKDDIICMLYGLIDRSKLHKWVESETGKSLDEITQDATELLKAYQDKLVHHWYDTKKVYKSDSLGDYIYLKLSDRKKEMPVNLVIRRDYLRHNNLIDEIYIDKHSVKRYNVPKLFSRADEILSCQ